MSTPTVPNESGSFVDELASKLGTSWPSLTAARDLAKQKHGILARLVEDETSPDVSIVVHGSLARLEFTSESDLDWTLLVDGQANPQHQKTLLRLRKKLEDSIEFHGPGRENTFGTLTFSHQIIHMIGGEDDSNTNTTRRILLLLEASAVGEHKQAFIAVRNNILDRYLNEDHGLGRGIRDENPRWIPLFLLNDIARYWRTMAVDFAYKQHTRGNSGYALRSLKLGISRKLIFASGLVSCFWCDPVNSREDPSEQFRHQRSIAALNEMILLTPLERMAKFYLSRIDAVAVQDAARHFFNSYEEFLTLLNQPEKRKLLEALTVDEMYKNDCFLEAREIRKRFKEAIRRTFLQPASPLYQHVIEFGVF